MYPHIYIYVYIGRDKIYIYIYICIECVPYPIWLKPFCPKALVQALPPYSVVSATVTCHGQSDRRVRLAVVVATFFLHRSHVCSGGSEVPRLWLAKTFMGQHSSAHGTALMSEGGAPTALAYVLLPWRRTPRKQGLGRLRALCLCPSPLHATTVRLPLLLYCEESTFPCCVRLGRCV